MERACEKAGSASALARLLKVTPTTVHEWRTGKRPVPMDRCPQIARATGFEVRCEELRPDIDWAAVREGSAA